jgi:hypothetical protein
MPHHLILSDVSLGQSFLHPVFEQYVKCWREDAIQRAEAGDVAASTCLQGTLIDLVLFGRVRHAWGEIMDAFLTHNGKPIAYSEAFGRRLHKFLGQYLQTTVHAIHTRWWIQCLVNPSAVDHAAFANMILTKRQTDGLIYDADVSETILRHRMKSEVTLSMAMSAEILQAARMLTGNLPLELATHIVDPRKCPTLGYISAEYFRLHALRTLGYENYFPTGIAEHIDACAKDLPVGWGDFAMKSKVDAYMGTAKRTQRDKPIHSPLIACHVAALVRMISTDGVRAKVNGRLTEYARHLTHQPLDIPAFQMRDVQIPFGSDKTPIEAICASHLIAGCQCAK